MTAFRYDPKIIQTFPNIHGGVLIASGMSNKASSESLEEIYHAEQQAVLHRIGSTPLSEIDTLAAWRSAFRVFGVNPTKYRSAAEALLRRLTKKGDIPSINTIVDICNLVSIRYGLPVASFDRRSLTGPITVRFAEGNEAFTPLFQDVAEHPDRGEVIFIDDAGLVVARRWCWRQSDESATRGDTIEAIFTIESHGPRAAEDIQAGLQDLDTLLREYVGGDFIQGVVNKDQIEI